jgi:phosphatidyl-myo-inositol dimannoside synthase
MAPRILLITRNLPPLLGGMERLNQRMAGALAGWSRLSVIGPAGCRQHLPEAVEVTEIPIRPLPLFLLRALWVAWRQARAGHYDLILAGSGLTAPIAVLVGWWAKAKRMAYVHGLDLVTRHFVYRALWLPAMRRLDHAFANSSSTADIAKRLGVARRGVTIIHPGTDLPELDPRRGEQFRVAYGLGSVPLLLSVGRLTERKGLLEFVRMALPRIHALYPDLALVVIGNEAPDALSGKQGGGVATVLAAAEELGLRQCLHFLGTCDDETLSQAYQAADVHVFPIRDIPGDIEGFGMVAIEAAAHGLRTVAFAVGGVPDAVNEGRNGCLIKPGAYDQFAKAVCELLDARHDLDARAGARTFAAQFHWDHFAQRLRDAISHQLEFRPGWGPTREGHAVLDLGSREHKARKIEALLALRPSGAPVRLLEIGTGSGGIAHYYATHPALSCDVDAVDVTDVRQLRDHYRFTKVEGVWLPFADDSFDVVISNHVIEHVGDKAAQCRHLQEIRRVLKSKGICYLAVPSRWMLVEPHYKLPFLSWLPKSLADAYVRFSGKGSHYDCRPLTTREIEPEIQAAGFTFVQHHGDALRLTYEIERPDALLYRYLFKPLPYAFYRLMRSAFPTLIYTLTPVDKAP